MNTAPAKKLPSHNSALRRARIIIAALAFLISLAAFIDFNNLAPTPLKHAFASTQFVPSALTFAAGFTLSTLACIVILALTLAFGRVYCSMLCPLGILQDIISRAAALIRRKPPYQLRHAKPRDLLRHGILALAIIAIAAGLGGIALAWLDPYSNFGRIITTLFRPLAIAVNNLAATLASALGRPDDIPQIPLAWAAPGALLPPLAILVAIVVTATLRGRLWCNTICPVGTLLGLVSRRSLWRLSIDKNACHKCAACLRACKAQCIDLRAGAIDHSRCVACYDCIPVCDAHGIGYRWHGLARDMTTTGRAVVEPVASLETPKPPPFSHRKSASSTPTALCPPAQGCPSPRGLPWVNDGNNSQPQRGCVLMGRAVVEPLAPPPPSPTRRAFLATAATAATTALAVAAAATRLATRATAQTATDTSARQRPIVSSEATGSTNRESKIENPIAPPGARATARILAQCTACQLCISVCPSRVLEPAVFEYGSFAGLMKPRLNYNRSFCEFKCTECLDVCPDGALTPLTLAQKQLTRIGVARVTLDRCIIVNKHTKCGACAEHCPTAALQIAQVPGYPDPVPVVDERYCIGCGGCDFACPPSPKAVIVHGLAVHETAEKLVQQKVKAPTTGDFAF